MEKYFKYDDEYITGGTYFLRSILNSFLSLVLIGIYLNSVTAYKRAKSLGHDDSATIWGIWGFLAFPLAFTPFAIITNTIPHWYLWFANGRGKSNLENQVEQEAKENILEQQKFADKKGISINELQEKIIDKEVNESIIPKKAIKSNEIDKVKIKNTNRILEISHKEMEKLDINDDKPGVIKTFYDKENMPFSGSLVCKKIDDNGRIECEYLNGIRHGEYIKYDSDNVNKISHTKYYKNGVLHGAFTYWWEKYKDGKTPKEEKDTPKFGDAKLDAMVGAMLKKHDIMMQINYKDGLMHGKWVNFNFNGGVNFEINFIDGKKDGIWRDYFQRPLGGQGALKKVSVYKKNKHISSKYYDFDGDEVSKEEVIDNDDWGGEAWEQDQKF
jgi:antitoxin component YwqK of YwqJK toxin-antitoxin module